MFRLAAVLAITGLLLACISLLIGNPIALMATAVSCILIALGIALHVDAKKRHAPFEYDPRGIVSPELQAPPPREVKPGRPLIVVALAFGISGAGALLLSFSSQFSRFERVMLVVAAAILLGFLPWMLPKLKKQREQMLRLARDGVVVIGEVIAEAPSGVRYRFVVDRVEVAGQSHFLKRPSIAPRNGDRLVVLYDPADPSQNVAAYSLRDVRFSPGGRRRGAAASGTG